MATDRIVSTLLTAHLGDADDWRGREAKHDVSPKAQHLRLRGGLGDVEMRDEEFRVGGLKHDDLHGRVRLEFIDHSPQLDDRRRDEHVDRRVAECDRPSAGVRFDDGELGEFGHGTFSSDRKGWNSV